MGREKKKSGEFWEEPKKPSGPAKPPMKRWKKVVVFGGGGLVLLLVLLVAMAPSIAGAMAPGIIADAAAGSIKGPVRVGAVDLSWTGTQRIGPVTIVDPTKPAGSNQVATVSVEINRGLLGLISAGLGSAPDLGEIRLAGDVKIVRSRDGTTNLDRALEPVKAASKDGSKGSSEPARVGRGTTALVLIDAIDVTYTDESAPRQGAAVKGLKGEVFVGPGDGGTVARVKLAAKASGGEGAEGAFKIDFKAGPIAGDDGVVRPEKMKLDATIDVSDMPTALVDSLAGMGGRLAAGLGPTLGLSVSANGSMKSATATVSLVSEGARVGGELAVADAVVTTSAPLIATLTGTAVRHLAGLDDTLARSGTATLTEAPGVSVSVDRLRMKLPAGGAAFDLAGAAGTLSLKTTAMAGTLKLQKDGAPSQFKVSPLEVVLTTEDASGDVKLTAAGDATISGQPAGTLGADLLATNFAAMMAAAGPGGALPSVKGIVSLKGAATAIVQPFVAAAGLDLARDVGPTLDAEVKIATAASGVGAGAVPPVTAELLVASEKLNAKGGFELKDSAVKSAGGPFTLNADSVGGLLARLVDPEGAYTVAPGGKLTIGVSDVSVPFKDGDLGKAQIDKAGLKVNVGVRGVAVTPSHAGGAGVAAGNLDISTFAIGIVAAPGAAPKLDLSGAMAYGGKPFTLAGAVEVPGLYSFRADGTPMVTPVAARPTGTIELKNVPTGLASLFGAQGSGEAAPPAKTGVPLPGGQRAEAGGAALDVGRFLADVIGPMVDVKLVSGASKSGDGVDLGAVVRAERLSADVQAGLSDKSVEVKRAAVDATVAPSALDTVLATYAPNIVPRPQLAGTSKLTLAVEPISIPVGRDKDGAARLDLARAGIAVVKVSLPQQTLLEKMVLKNADGSTTDLGQLGVEGFDIVAKVPLAAADPASAAAQRFDVTLAGRALDGPGSVLLKISGSASGEMAGSGVRTADANFAITDVRVLSIDRLAGKPGLVSGAIGESAAVNLVARVRPDAGGAGTATEAEVSLQAPRVKMSEPLRVTVLPDRVRADKAVQLAWTVEPAWANQHMLAPPPGSGKGSAATLKSPVTMSVTVGRFAVASGEGRGPLLASVFDLGVAATLSAMEFAMPDGSAIRMAGTRVDVQSAPGGAIAGDTVGAQSAGVGFNLKVDEVGVKPAPGGAAGGAAPPAKGVTLSGRVEGLSDASGNISAKTAAVSANGDIPEIPTALIDLLANQQGLLVDALGPTASAQIRADRFSASGGTLDLNARSDRASASVRGSVSEGVFVASEPIKASLSEITAALARRFIKGMPLVGTVEKKPTDEPALITASSMRVPLDNDMRKLDGEVLIDPGVARFTSGDTFGKILKAINQKSEANIGQRIDPLHVHIKQGVATYDTWAVPIGQNRLSTRGTVDLVNQTLDVITYVPLGALTEDVAGLFKAQAKLQQALGGTGLDEKLMVPFRSRGTFDKVKTEPDMELFLKETVKSIKPEDLIKKGIGDLLKPKPKPSGGGN